MTFYFQDKRSQEYRAFRGLQERRLFSLLSTPGPSLGLSQEELVSWLDSLKNPQKPKNKTTQNSQRKVKKRHPSSLKVYVQDFARKEWKKDPSLGISRILLKNSFKQVMKGLAESLSKKIPHIGTLRNWLSEIDPRPAEKKPGNNKSDKKC